MQNSPQTWYGTAHGLFVSSTQRSRPHWEVPCIHLTIAPARGGGGRAHHLEVCQSIADLIELYRPKTSG